MGIFANAVDLKNISWMRVMGAISSVILVLLIIYGAYQYYFSKPIPIVNNYTVQSGGKIDLKQNDSVKKDRRLITGIVFNHKEIMGSVSWLW